MKKQVMYKMMHKKSSKTAVKLSLQLLGDWKTAAPKNWKIYVKSQDAENNGKNTIAKM